MSGLYRKDGPLTCNCECAHTTTMLTNVETTAKIVLTIEMIYTNTDFNHAVDIIPGNMYTIQYLEDGELKQCSGMVKDIYKVYALDEETGIYKIKIDCSVNYNNNVVVIKSDQIRDVRAYVKYADEDTTIDTSTHSYGTTVAALIKDAIVTSAELDANGNILKGVIVQGSLNGSKTVDGIAKGTNRSGHEIYVINGTSTNGSIASGYILNAIAISGDIDGDKDPTTGYVTNATVKGIISEAVIIDSIITDCKTEGGTVIEGELKRPEIFKDDKIAHEYVDLGLSVKWATMNIGAAKISDCGSYFAWGETSSKEDYTWSAYKYGSSADDLVKYSLMDNMTRLVPEDDAATVNWGGAWRMPTSSEWEELCNRCNCTWEWTSIENTPGFRIMSKKAGFTDKSIFLQAAGYFRGQAIEGIEKSAYYWSSTRNEPFADRALCLYFIPNFIGIGNNGFRNGGFTIRPVI